MDTTYAKSIPNLELAGRISAEDAKILGIPIR